MTAELRRVGRFPRVALGCFAVVLLGAMASCLILDQTGWESARMQLDPTATLILYRKHSHPFLAEFRRRVKILEGSRTVVNLNAPHDPGGGFPMAICFYADEQQRFVRITDENADSLIDLRTGDYVREEPASAGGWRSGYVGSPEEESHPSAFHEEKLPPLQRCFSIDRDFQVSSGPAAEQVTSAILEITRPTKWKRERPSDSGPSYRPGELMLPWTTTK